MTDGRQTCASLLFAESSGDLDGLFLLAACCWGLFVLPGTIFGVLGIVAAFQGNRKSALRRGAFATILPLTLLALLVGQLFAQPGRPNALNNPLVFSAIAIPLAAA